MADRPACLPSRCRWAVFLCLVAVFSLVFSAASLGASDPRQTPIVRAVERARPSVVNIRGEKTIAATGSQIVGDDAGRRVNGMGTGVVIDRRGYVMTNYHVVEGVREIQVTLADGEQHTAELISRDPETDLAIVKIIGVDLLPVIPIGTSHDLMPGEPVVAVGNAYGYEHTVTRGIISALHRAVQVSDAQFYDDLIQTDASINPGNSGGPLLNINGDMIGINVAVRAGAQGIGFAIPVDKAVAVVAELLAATNSEHAWHGVELASDSPRTAPGLIVAAVEEASPAAKAGLRPGDVVIDVAGLPLMRALDFHRAVFGLEVGQPLQLSVQRKDATIALEFQLAESTRVLKPVHGPWWELLGLELRPIPARQFREQFETRYRGGLTVVDVRPDSTAYNQGIRNGDVLVGMHIWETISLDNVAYIVKSPEFADLNPVKFFILRGNETLYGYLPVTMRASHQR